MVVVKKITKNAPPEKTRIRVDDPRAASKIQKTLLHLLQQLNISLHQPISLLCIGTDRSTGDCLGPLVGSKLKQSRQSLFNIQGTLDHPLHAGNLQSYLDQCQSQKHQPLVIALDACLGHTDQIGSISIGAGSLQPGAGVHKTLPRVGHIYITGIVNIGGFMEFMVLQNTRLNLVMRMADTIADGLLQLNFLLQQPQTQAMGATGITHTCV